MEAKNRFQCVHNCLADVNAELVDLFWLLFFAAGDGTAELKVSWVNYQLYRTKTIHREDIICMKQDVVAIT